MPFEVDEEDVIPGLAARGSRLDLREVDFLPGKLLEEVAKGADAVLYREHDRCLVMARRCFRLPADDEKAGDVVESVLYLAAHRLEAVEVAGEAAGDGRSPAVFGSEAGRLRGA